MRWVWIGVFTLVALALLTPAAGLLLLRTSLPDFHSSVRLEGISAPVQIMRDAQAVPHVFAATDADAYFAMGYLHAQDRLWQMHLQRRIGAGRLAEMIGPSGVGYDRLMRTLGTYRLAEASYANLSREVREAFDAYAAGVNAWLETRRGALPPEFYLLRTTPEPWKPADSLVWGKLMASQLSGNYRTELLRADIAAALGEEAVALLFPAIRSGEPVTLAEAPPRESLSRLRAALPAPLGPTSASNVWAVTAAGTTTGGALLANDPHLGLDSPSVFYLARVRTPTLNLVGATVPGVPFHLLGHNGRVAWGMSTTGADVQDLFVERIDPDDPTRYLTPDGSMPFVVRRETIEVRGAEPIALTVRETRHGPVLSDIDTELRTLADQDHVVALAFAALTEADTTSEAIYLMGRATNWVEFLGALQFWVAPVQNVAYADVDGNIGLIAPGRIPVRADGDGLAPVPGWTGAYDWTGFLPVEALPQVLNPPSGRIVNANNPVVGPDYPHWIGHEDVEPYRADRIEEVLRNGRHGIDETAALQMDTVSVAARDLLPLMLTVRPDNAAAAEAVRLLRGWSYEMDRKRPEPLIFSAWLRALNRTLFADDLGPIFGDYWGLRPRVVRAVLTDRQDWCDDRATARTETCAEQLRVSLDDALAEIGAQYGDDLSSLRWGDAHSAPFAHQMFSRVPVAKSLVDLSIETDGGPNTVNRGNSRIGDSSAPFAHIHGSVFRAIFDLSDLDNSRFIIATGQSGNPFSPHFGDLVERWRDGDAFTIAGSPTELARGGNATLTLHPLKQSARP
ncbi:MAG: penicillin acylase family protein [Inquilinus sp.]|nr:penicillin acylase family protein [Inquilinus sp.]